MVSRCARSGWLPALVVLLAVLGSCQRPSDPAPPPPAPAAEASKAGDKPGAGKLSWTAESRDGRMKVRQWETAPNTCVVESTGGRGWTVPRCLGGPTLEYFVSPDGEALLVLDPLPVGPDEAWATAPVVTLYVRGEETKKTNAGALVLDEARLRRFNKRFAWALGSGGLVGAKPDYANASEVVGTTADGREFRFGFDGRGIPAPVTAPAARAAVPAPPADDRPTVIEAATAPQPEPEPVIAMPARAPPKDVFSYCTYPERAGSRNFFMCIRAPPSTANGLCSREMSAQYESRVVCSCSEDRSGECEKMLR